MLLLQQWHGHHGSNQPLSELDFRLIPQDESHIYSSYCSQEATNRKITDSWREPAAIILLN